MLDINMKTNVRYIIYDSGLKKENNHHSFLPKKSLKTLKRNQKHPQILTEQIKSYKW